MFKVGASVEQIYLVYKNNRPKEFGAQNSWHFQVASLTSTFMKFSIWKNYFIKF